MKGALPPLRPYQQDIMRAVSLSIYQRAGRSFSVEIARQGGKNETSAQLEMFVLLQNCAHPIENVKAAPSLRPQGRVSMRRLLNTLRTAGLDRDGFVGTEDNRIVRVGLARQVFLGAGAGSNVAGHTAHLLLEADEAQDINADYFDHQFRPMAAANNATIVYWGTTWTDDTLLARAKARHIEQEQADGIRRHFAADWRAVAAHVPAYGRYVEGERDRLGPSNPLFLTQYELQTIAGAGRLLHAQDIAAAFGPAETPPGVVARVAGLDIAGDNALNPRADATVLTLGVVAQGDPYPHITVTEQHSWTGQPYHVVQANVAGILASRETGTLAYDATGIGATWGDYLRRHTPGVRLLPFSGTSRTKSELGYALLTALITRRLRVPDGLKELAGELAAVRAEYAPNQELRWHVPPADGHDDRAFSLALLIHAANASVPRIARGRTREEATP